MIGGVLSGHERQNQLFPMGRFVYKYHINVYVVDYIH